MWEKIKTYLIYYLFGKYCIAKYKEIPIQLNKFTIYIIEDWSILLKCPCGCTNDVQLNTLEGCAPSWSYEIHKNNISISPSVKRNKGCRSHFWIKKGKILWV